MTAREMAYMYRGIDIVINTVREMYGMVDRIVETRLHLIGIQARNMAKSGGMWGKDRVGVNEWCYS